MVGVTSLGVWVAVCAQPICLKGRSTIIGNSSHHSGVPSLYDNPRRADSPIGDSDFDPPRAMSCPICLPRFINLTARLDNPWCMPTATGLCDLTYFLLFRIP